MRKADESVSSYVAELHSLAVYCNLGATLEVMLRDRLVCGINNEGIQNKLLAETDLTYGKALDIARSLEVAVTKFAGPQINQQDTRKWCKSA